MNQIRNLIAIGASAGGIRAIIKVIEGFPETIDAAIMIELHLSRKSSSQNIIEIFQRHTTLKCEVAQDMMEIEKGKIYLARPEHHLMVKNNLTGMLDDGNSGMYAIKSCGGLCLIQNPSQSEYSDMPLNVLRRMEVDYIADLVEIPIIVQDLLKKPLPSQIAIPNELKVEAEITEKLMSDINDLKKIAKQSDFVCPDCGGGLWQIKNDPTHRYRCYTGHVYTEKLLQYLQDLKIEESIWIAIRMIEEKRNMLQLLVSRRNGATGNQTIFSLNKRIAEIGEHIQRLKTLVIKLSDSRDDIHSA